MDYVYLIWEDVDDWAENGGGISLVSIYANKEDADKECRKLNENRPAKNVEYFVDKGAVK